MLKIFIFLLFSFSAHAKMYLKLEGESIVGHDYHQHGDYQVEIGNQRLVDSNGVYRFKYVDGQLTQLSEADRNNHPLKKINQLRQLMFQEKIKNQKIRDINQYKVNENLFYLLKRLRPSLTGKDITILPKGGGRSIYERVQMDNKPTFEELQSELSAYKAEKISKL